MSSGARPVPARDSCVARREALSVAVLFAAGLAVHTVVALWMLPPWRFLKYPMAAEQLLAGQLPLERLVDFSPLYLDVHLLAQRLPGSIGVLRVLQVVLVATAVCLFYSLLRRRFPVAPSMVAALLLLLDRTLLVYTHVLEPEVWLLFFLVLLLWSLQARWRSALLVAGLAGALGLATRPTLLPVLVAVPLWLWLGDDGEARPLGRRLFLFAVPVVAALLLLGLRSHRVTGDALTPMMNPGTVFFEGNNPLSLGTSAVYPPLVMELTQRPDTRPDSAHEDYRRVARLSQDRELTVAEVNAYWSRLARRFLLDEPGRALGLARIKLSLALHNERLHDVPAAWLFDRRLLLPGLPFGLLTALALPGMLFAARAWRRHLVLYAVVGGQVSVMLLLYVSARQRLLLLPALLIFALLAYERLRRPPRRLWLALVAVSFVALSLPNDLLREETHRNRRGTELAIAQRAVLDRFALGPRAWFTDEAAALLALVPEGIDYMRPAFLSQEGMPLAERVLAGAVRRGAGSLAERFDVAVLILRAGHLQEAEARFAELDAIGYRAYRGSLSPPLPLYFLGRVALLRGERDVAVARQERALDMAPGDPFVLAELLALTEEPRYQELLDRYYSRLDSQLLLGRAFLALGEHEKAASCFAYLVRRLPELRSAKVYLAASLAGGGRIEAAAAAYFDAMAQAPEPLLLDPEIPDLMRAWGDRVGASGYDRLRAAQILHLYGYLSEARDRLRSFAASAGEREPADLVAAAQGEAERIEHALAPP